MEENNFMNGFISVGKLREMLSSLGDDDMITVTRGNTHPNYKISHVEDSTSAGFWELRVDEEEAKGMKYPTTYADCCKIAGDPYEDDTVTGYRRKYLGRFQQLLRCRDAYWKLAGDWRPDYSNNNQIKYCISFWGDHYLLDIYYCKVNPSRLVFPTKEMRDVFFSNFKEMIDDCKELI